MIPDALVRDWTLSHELVIVAAYYVGAAHNIASRDKISADTGLKPTAITKALREIAHRRWGFVDRSGQPNGLPTRVRPNAPLTLNGENPGAHVPLDAVAKVRGHSSSKAIRLLMLYAGEQNRRGGHFQMSDRTAALLLGWHHKMKAKDPVKAATSSVSKSRKLLIDCGVIQKVADGQLAKNTPIYRLADPLQGEKRDQKIGDGDSDFKESMTRAYRTFFLDDGTSVDLFSSFNERNAAGRAYLKADSDTKKTVNALLRSDREVTAKQLLSGPLHTFLTEVPPLLVTGVTHPTVTGVTHPTVTGICTPSTPSSPVKGHTSKKRAMVAVAWKQAVDLVLPFTPDKKLTDEVWRGLFALWDRVSLGEDEVGKALAEVVAREVAKNIAWNLERSAEPPAASKIVWGLAKSAIDNELFHEARKQLRAKPRRDPALRAKANRSTSALEQTFPKIAAMIARLGTSHQTAAHELTLLSSTLGLTAAELDEQHHLVDEIIDECARRGFQATIDDIVHALREQLADSA